MEFDICIYHNYYTRFEDLAFVIYFCTFEFRKGSWVLGLYVPRSG